MSKKYIFAILNSILCIPALSLAIPLQQITIQTNATQDMYNYLSSNGATLVSTSFGKVFIYHIKDHLTQPIDTSKINDSLAKNGLSIASIQCSANGNPLVHCKTIALAQNGSVLALATQNLNRKFAVSLYKITENQVSPITTLALDPSIQIIRQLQISNDGSTLLISTSTDLNGFANNNNADVYHIHADNSVNLLNSEHAKINNSNRFALSGNGQWIYATKALKDHIDVWGSKINNNDTISTVVEFTLNARGLAHAESAPIMISDDATTLAVNQSDGLIDTLAVQYHDSAVPEISAKKNATSSSSGTAVTLLTANGNRVWSGLPEQGLQEITKTSNDGMAPSITLTPVTLPGSAPYVVQSSADGNVLSIFDLHADSGLALYQYQNDHSWTELETKQPIDGWFPTAALSQDGKTFAVSTKNNSGNYDTITVYFLNT